MNQKLPKTEILRSRKIIQELFQASSSFLYAYPLQVRWIARIEKATSQFFPQVLFSVSKKKFKKATVRNLIRRRLKEAYRKNKAQFFEALSQIDYLAIVYIAKDVVSYQEIEKALCKIFSDFSANNNENR